MVQSLNFLQGIADHCKFRQRCYVYPQQVCEEPLKLTGSPQAGLAQRRNLSAPALTKQHQDGSNSRRWAVESSMLLFPWGVPSLRELLLLLLLFAPRAASFWQLQVGWKESCFASGSIGASRKRASPISWPPRSGWNLAYKTWEEKKLVLKWQVRAPPSSSEFCATCGVLQEGSAEGFT